ncbi:hypothetical protein LDENG_00002720 [Lucifuga dentata]|nr:hypothetical protein LDENG_00002720 [Lucifuga dentata]
MLRKILSYLDASSLLSLSHVNKLFHQLSNDDAAWKTIYISEFGKNKRLLTKWIDEVVLRMGIMEMQDGAVGDWKRLYLRSAATRHMNKWETYLKCISSHTGLPSQTEQVLRNLDVTWELTVSVKSVCKGSFELSWSRFFETSVILCWNGGSWSEYQQISSFQLHGVTKTAPSCPCRLKPGRRSLMETFDVEPLTKIVIGHDKLVELIFLPPGVIIGNWRGQRSVAFVMVSLHFHRLVEKSIQGSFFCPYVEPVVKPPFDDIDPEYGLHGYQLHIVLHSTVCEIMSRSFSQLFCRRDEIQDGLIQLTAISRTNLSQHTCLSGNISLPWRCEGLEGSVENCCIMSVTLLDEFRKPFWCVSSPVSMVRAKEAVFYNYADEHFLIHYQDTDGQVKMKLAWVTEEEQYFLVSLIVYVSICKVNQYFSKDY